MARNSPTFLLSPFPQSAFLLDWCPSPTLYLCQGLFPLTFPVSYHSVIQLFSLLPEFSCSEVIYLTPTTCFLQLLYFLFFIRLRPTSTVLPRLTKIQIQIVHFISFIFRCAKMYVFGLLGEFCILYDEKYACAKHHAKKYDCFVPRAKSTHQRRRRKNK